MAGENFRLHGSSLRRRLQEQCGLTPSPQGKQAVSEPLASLASPRSPRPVWRSPESAPEGSRRPAASPRTDAEPSVGVLSPRSPSESIPARSSTVGPSDRFEPSDGAASAASGESEDKEQSQVPQFRKRALECAQGSQAAADMRKAPKSAAKSRGSKKCTTAGVSSPLVADLEAAAGESVSDAASEGGLMKRPAAAGKLADSEVTLESGLMKRPAASGVSVSKFPSLKQALKRTQSVCGVDPESESQAAAATRKVTVSEGQAAPAIQVAAKSVPKSKWTGCRKRPAAAVSSLLLADAEAAADESVPKAAWQSGLMKRPAAAGEFADSEAASESGLMKRPAVAGKSTDSEAASESGLMKRPAVAGESADSEGASESGLMKRPAAAGESASEVASDSRLTSDEASVAPGAVEARDAKIAHFADLSEALSAVEPLLCPEVLVGDGGHGSENDASSQREAMSDAGAERGVLPGGAAKQMEVLSGFENRMVPDAERSGPGGPMSPREFNEYQARRESCEPPALEKVHLQEDPAGGGCKRKVMISGSVYKIVQTTDKRRGGGVKFCIVKKVLIDDDGQKTQEKQMFQITEQAASEVGLDYMATASRVLDQTKAVAEEQGFPNEEALERYMVVLKEEYI